MKWIFLGLLMTVLFLWHCTPCKQLTFRDTVIVHDNKPIVENGWVEVPYGGNLDIDTVGGANWVFDTTSRLWFSPKNGLHIDSSKWTWYVDNVGTIEKNGIVTYKDPVKVPKNFFHCPPTLDSIIFFQDPMDQNRIHSLERQLQDRNNQIASAKKDFEDLRSKFPWWWFALGALVCGWLGFKAKKL